MCKPVIKNTCVVCSKEFIASKPTVKTCSKQCKHELVRRRYAEIKQRIYTTVRKCKCRQCEKEFEAAGPRQKRFCSQRCYKIHQSAQRREHYRKMKNYADEYTATCKVCGNEFTEKRLRKQRVMCSEECRIKSLKKSHEIWRKKAKSNPVRKVSETLEKLHEIAAKKTMLKQDVAYARNDVANALRRLGL